MAYGNRNSGIDTVSALGAAVLDARRAAGLRQRDLATLAGVSPAWIVRLERAQSTNIELGRLFRVLQALGLTIELQTGHVSEADAAAALILGKP